jgi:transposase
VRAGLKGKRGACINRIRGVLTQFGRLSGPSPRLLRALLADIIEDAGNEFCTTAPTYSLSAASWSTVA